MNVSIEYSHTYLGHPIEKEHEIGAQITKILKVILDGYGLSTSRVLMIDDYNFPDDNREKYSACFINFLESMSIKPTHLIWESDCVGAAKYILDLIPSIEPGINKFGKNGKDGELYIHMDNAKNNNGKKNQGYIQWKISMPVACSGI